MTLTPPDSTIENAGDIQAVIFAPLVIDPIFGNSITSLTGAGADPTTAAEIENAINAAINFYDTNFTSSVPATTNNGTVSNAVTVTIQFDYGMVDGNAMARGGGVSESESSGPVYLTYAQLQSAVAGALPNLPAGDPTGGGGFLVTDSQAEVLGLPGISPGVDGYVGLNTIANGVTLDYNLADQSITGEIGVVGALEHEIAEDFGRIAVDGTESEQQSIGSVITTTPLYSILDLFRFSAPGKPAVTPGPADYFSLDNGTTDLGAFNNISNGGDAGDWASSVVADSFDAFITTGTAGTISALDRMVLNAIGLPPAPAVLTISGAAADQFTSDTSGLLPFDNVTVADRQANQIETVIVTPSVMDNGTLSDLGGGSYDPTTGVYTVSGSSGQVSTALDGLVFNPTLHQAAAGRTVTTGFTIDVTDTAGASATDSTTSVIVTATAAPAPVISGAAADQTVTDQTTVAPFVSVTITDPGAGQTETVTVTLSAAGDGTLSNLDGGTYNSTAGIYTVSGTPASVTAALDGLVFTPTLHQTAAGQTVTTNFIVAATDTAGVTVTDGTTSVVTTETAAPASAISAAYVAILRMQPDRSLLNAAVNQIATGQLTLAQFETSLINGEQAVYTTLPALVTIDAFYDATPSNALLTTVAAATAGTPYDTAEELHNLGYSDPNVWTILGAGWGADHGSDFFGLYSADATGATAGYTTFLDAAYQREFGFQPAAANLQSLLADIPGLTALLSGGGNIATPLQVMGGLYGYLLYAGQTNDIGRYASPADAFLQAAANGTVTYGPELTREFPTGTNVISITSAEQLIDPGAGNHAIRFLTGGAGVVSGFDSAADVEEIGSLLSDTGLHLSNNVAASMVGRGPDASLWFNAPGGGNFTMPRGLGSTVGGVDMLVTRGALKI